MLIVVRESGLFTKKTKMLTNLHLHSVLFLSVTPIRNTANSYHWLK